ncbi:MAG: hypothetical protein JWL86_1111, partial [Rhizobium sp.]|nr:hypothetical protein [Rhizobium sp.]
MHARFVMTRYLAPKRLALFFLLAAMTSVSVRDAQAGLVLEDSAPLAADAIPDDARSCEGVAFSRSLKYRESDQNV